MDYELEAFNLRRLMIKHLSTERMAITNEIEQCSKWVKTFSDRMVLLDQRDRILRVKIEKLEEELACQMIKPLENP